MTVLAVLAVNSISDKLVGIDVVDVLPQLTTSACICLSYDV